MYPYIRIGTFSFFLLLFAHIHILSAQSVLIHSIDKERISVCSGITKDVANHLYGIGIMNKSAQYKANVLFINKWDEQEQLLWHKEWTANNYYLEPKIISSGADVYITGTFYHKIDIDGRVLEATNPKVATVFVVKLDNQGKVIWLKRMDSEYFVDIRDIAISKEGHIICVGGFTRNVKIDNMLLEGNSSSNSLIVEYNEEGKVLWARTDKSKYSSLTAVAVDKDDNILIGGRFRDNVHWDSTAAANKTPVAIAPYVSRLDSRGRALWTRSAESMGYNAFVYDLTTDKNGDVYLTGLMEGVGDWKERTTAKREKEEAFLTKYSASGDFQWVKTLGGSNNNEYDAGMSIEVDKENNVWWAGNVTLDSSSIEGFPVEVKGEMDIFRMRCKPNGKIQEVKIWGGDNKEWIKSVLSDGKENVYLAGFYYVETEWGDTYLTSLATQKQGFIAKLPNPKERNTHINTFIPSTFIEISPNPTKVDFTVIINDLKVPLTSFTVKDSKGNVIFIDTMDPTFQFKKMVSVTSWEEGLYVLSFEFGNGAVITRKIMKE